MHPWMILPCAVLCMVIVVALLHSYAIEEQLQALEKECMDEFRARIDDARRAARVLGGRVAIQCLWCEAVVYEGERFCCEKFAAALRTLEAEEAKAKNDEAKAVDAVAADVEKAKL